MRRAQESRGPAVAAALGAFVATMWLVAFIWVWIGQWSVGPSRYADAGEWWRKFALPRAGWSLVIGVPVGCAVGVVVLRCIVRQAARRTGSPSP
jgi:hypothetical protein